MKITILGAGALGSLFGGLLARSGHDVTLYNRSHLEHVRMIRERGLTIEAAEGEFSVRVRATSAVSELEPPDLAAIFVKAYATRQVIHETRSLLQSVPWVMSLQNGVGLEELILEQVPLERFLRGTTSHGATLLSPGRVRWAGKGLTYLGRWRDAPTPEVQSIVAAFERAGLVAHLSPNPEEQVWRKLIINSAINPLTALFSVPNGDLLTDPVLHELGEAVTRESVAVARARGFDFSEPEMIARVETVCRQTAGNISSMLQDVRRGKPTEIDFICGAIVREGGRLGLCTPLNLLLAQLIRRGSRTDDVAGTGPMPDIFLS